MPAACGRVSDKLYLHAYDEAAGGCLRATAGYAFSRQSNFGEYRRWRSSRIHTELLLHVLHATGVVTWMQ